MMETNDAVLLANSIKSFALSHYIPFTGFDVKPIIKGVRKHFNVSIKEVLLALEVICQRGV
jgi:hypothetical protein